MLGEALIALFTAPLAVFFDAVLQAFVIGLVVPFFDFLVSALCLT